MKERAPSKVSVILPTYNEKGNIIKLIPQILRQLDSIGMQKEIIVVDDNSPDQTGTATKKQFFRNKDVKVFIRTEEKGFATAIRYGIERSTGDIIIVMDTDFNHDPDKLPQFVHFLSHYDIVSGSRYVMGGGMPGRFRYMGSFFFNSFVRLLLSTKIRDNLCGYFSIRRKKLFSLPFDEIFFGYGDYFFRLLYFAEKKYYQILEIPVYYKKRLYGQSKSNLVRVLLKYAKAVLALRFHAKRKK